MNMANSNVSLEGTALLNDPVHNRGTAFTEEERTSHHLEGLLPAAVDDLPTQLKRVLGHLSAKPTALEQYIYLQDLCDRNETLFYTTLMSDPARFVPIVYDPTIADACLTYGHIYRRPQGMYLNKRMKCRGGARQLAREGHPLHLRVLGRTHPRSGRYRGQRRADPDRQAPA